MGTRRDQNDLAGYYRTAAAAVVEARANALDLWPTVPPEIVVTTSRQRGFFGGCFDLERDLDGEVVCPKPYN
jgi:hypothetical protein